MKLTRRDLAVATLGAGLSGCVFALAPAVTGVIGSSTYPWDAMKANKSPVGETRQVIKGPTATLEELEVHITDLNAGQSSHPPHHHANEELILLERGTVETLSRGKWVRLGPGSVVLNGSEDWHSFRNVGTDQAQYFVVNWRTPATDAIAARNPPDGTGTPPPVHP